MGVPEQMRIPERLAARLASEPDEGAAWLEALPGIVQRLVVRWELELEEPIQPGGVTSVVLPARRADGAAAVLKVPVPDDEIAGEAEGLALVDGDGAVLLLEYDPDSGALLLEAADPTRSLLDLPDAEQASAAAADLLRRWWRPVPPDTDLPRLTDVAPGLVEELEARRPWLTREVGVRLIDRAVAILADADHRADTLLHTDLHQGNALAAEREPWLVIDPKPLVGEREYDVEPLLRDHRGPAASLPSVETLVRRFDATSAQLGVDRERARDWVVGRAVLHGSWDLEVGGRLGHRQLHIARTLAT